MLSFILSLPMFLFRCNETVEVATNEVANHQAGVEHQHLGQVGEGETRGYGEVIKRVSQAVREAAVNEEGHAKQQRCILTFTSEGYYGSHNEAAADGQQACTHGADGKAAFENFLRGTAQVDR